MAKGKQYAAEAEVLIEAEEVEVAAEVAVEAVEDKAFNLPVRYTVCRDTGGITLHIKDGVDEFVNAGTTQSQILRILARHGF